MVEPSRTLSASHIGPPRELAAYFQVRKDIHFLNHGSFGACPLPVMETYQNWQRELEQQPLEFLGRRIPSLLREAREKLGAFVGADGDDVVFVPNTTNGINIIARSLKLEPGDEILATDHEYGAVDRTWRFNCNHSGARYLRQTIDTPVDDPNAMVDQLWEGVTERTKILVVSHITSPTALIFPVAEICRRAREAGIMTVIDGAHAPGQIDLDMRAIGADFYIGNCHKWLCAPKGSAFVYARRELQPLLHPLVVSWGWESHSPTSSQFIDHLEWTGTDDPSAFLSVPAAIAFQTEHDWSAVRAACHELAQYARHQMTALTGLPPISPETTQWWSQMCVLPVPMRDPRFYGRRLWDEYQIEIPVTYWNNQSFVRLSIQAYNTREDVDALVSAIGDLMERERAEQPA